MSLPQPTPLYDAVAAALSPLSIDGRVALNVAVLAAAAVAQEIQDEDAATIEALEDQVTLLTAQLLLAREQHASRVRELLADVDAAETWGSTQGASAEN